jgi:hypothetical protein
LTACARSVARLTFSGRESRCAWTMTGFSQLACHYERSFIYVPRDLVTPLPHCGFFCGFYTWTCNGLFLREAGAPRRASLGTRVRRVATKCKPQNLTTNLMKSFWLLPKSITRGNTSCRDTCIYIYIYHVNMCIYIYISAGDVVVSKLH